MTAMGLLKKLCLPNATLFFISQVTLMVMRVMPMIMLEGMTVMKVAMVHGGKDDNGDPPPPACDQLRLHHRLHCA